VWGIVSGRMVPAMIITMFVVMIAAIFASMFVTMILTMIVIKTVTMMLITTDFTILTMIATTILATLSDMRALMFALTFAVMLAVMSPAMIPVPFAVPYAVRNSECPTFCLQYAVYLYVTLTCGMITSMFSPIRVVRIPSGRRPLYACGSTTIGSLSLPDGNGTVGSIVSCPATENPARTHIRLTPAKILLRDSDERRFHARCRH
jgi:hypothetical protein